MADVHEKSRLRIGGWIALGTVVTGLGLYVWIWTRLPK